jgi:hypothetical protein
MRKYSLNKINLQKLIFVLTLIINALLVLILFSGLSSKNINIYLSSDMLYLPSIYKDLFIDKSGLAGWNLNAAPNFLPDMMIFFIIRSFFSHFIPACFTFSILQVVTVIILLGSLYKIVFKELNYIHLSFASLLMSMFLMAYLVNHDFVYSFYMLSISYHIGAFIMAIISMILMFKFLKTEKNLHLAILFTISLLSVINDKLYVIMFSLPVFSLLIILMLKKEKRILFIKILVVNTISLVLGLFLYRMLKLSGFVHIIGLSWKTFNFGNIIPSLKIFLEQHIFYISKFDFRGIINLLFLCSFITHIILLIKNLIKAFKGKEFNRNEFTYLLIFTSFLFFTLIAPIINGSYVSQAIFRYNIYSLYAGVFSIGFLLYKFRIPFNYLKIVLVIMLFVESVFIISKVKNQDIINGLSNFLNYYPEEVQYIDQLAKENNLKYGVADYWNAKHTTMFSRQNVRVYTVLNDVAAWYHVTNQNWFYKEGKGDYGNPEFTFIITQRLNKENISKQLGNPIDTLYCANGLEIFVFPEFEFDKKTRKPTIKE